MPHRIGVLAGAFNPVTRAHLALLNAARAHVDQRVCVIPARYPHKNIEGATVEQRVRMLEQAAPECGIARTEGGLFIDIARELRRATPHADVWFLCGADAAERIVTWDYGEPQAIHHQLREFGLLVAARGERYQPPEELRHRIVALEIGEAFHDVSSTEVRQRIAAGQAWQHLVPEAIHPLVTQIY